MKLSCKLEMKRKELEPELFKAKKEYEASKGEETYWAAKCSRRFTLLRKLSETLESTERKLKEMGE